MRFPRYGWAFFYGLLIAIALGVVMFLLLGGAAILLSGYGDR